MALCVGGGTEGGGGGAGDGGTATGAPGSGAALKTMSKPCSATSSAPWRGARGSSSKKTTNVKSKCASTETRIARPPKPGLLGLGQVMDLLPSASGAPGRLIFGSARRIGRVELVLTKYGATRRGAELPNGSTLLHQMGAPG